MLIVAVDSHGGKLASFHMKARLRRGLGVSIAEMRSWRTHSLIMSWCDETTGDKQLLRPVVISQYCSVRRESAIMILICG